MAYVDPLEDNREEAFIMRVDGSERTQLTDDDGRTFGLDWSPDGRYLAYNSTVAGNSDIYTYDTQTGLHRRLTTDPAVEHQPRWAPDGRYMVFTSERTGAERVYRINADGTGLRMIRTRDRASSD